MNSDLVYLDYAATTPTDQRVVEQMIPYFTHKYGNPASRTHDFGKESKEAVKLARGHLVDLINAEREEDVIFTSGATEAINLGIKGVYQNYKKKGNHIVTTVVEHKAVLDTCMYLEQQGASVTYLDVDENGLVCLDDLRLAITSQTILVCIIYVNNETGVVQPIGEFAELCQEKGIFFMTDATQAIGKIPLDVKKQNIDLMAFSAHKIYGPNGIGALYVKSKFPRIKVAAQIHGGGHEGGYRSGTLNTPGIVGFGVAAFLCRKESKMEFLRLSKVRNDIENHLLNFANCHIHGANVMRAPHISNFYFEGLDAEAMIIQLRDRIAISNGSACTSHKVEPSHVIMAMRKDQDIAYCSLRLSIGRFTPDNISEVVYEAFYDAHELIKNYS